MSETPTEVKLKDGTLIRHKVIGYEGRTDGVTALRSCFTRLGGPLGNVPSKQTYQYRVLIAGEALRRIAPLEDLEILEASTEVTCAACHSAFNTKPGYPKKAGGLCSCGGWICPSCWLCQPTSACPQQRLRLLRKAAAKKKL